MAWKKRVQNGVVEAKVEKGEDFWSTLVCITRHLEGGESFWPLQPCSARFRYLDDSEDENVLYLQIVKSAAAGMGGEYEVLRLEFQDRSQLNMFMNTVDPRQIVKDELSRLRGRLKWYSEKQKKEAKNNGQWKGFWIGLLVTCGFFLVMNAFGVF